MRRLPRLVRIVADLPAPLVEFLIAFSEDITDDGKPDIGLGLIDILASAHLQEAEAALHTLHMAEGVH